MESLIKFRDILNAYASKDGVHETGIPGVSCIKFSKAGTHGSGNWRMSVCVVAQGKKELTLENSVFRYGEGQYVAASVDLLVNSRVVEATLKKPYLCLRIDFQTQDLSEIAARMEVTEPKEMTATSRGLFVGKADEKVLESALRLAKLFDTPQDARVLAPSFIREILYYLLKGQHGESIRQFARQGSNMQRISEAIFKIKENLAEDIDVDLLVKESNMSKSSFFSHFKKVTALSPIQYQKRLRLIEARQMLINSEENAEGVAFRVGYKSTSQFSREYSRMFGNSPIRDALKAKKRILLSGIKANDF